MTPSPPATTAADAKALAGELARCRAFSLDRVRELMREFTGETAAEFAEFLVSRKELTPFQAQRVLAGETKALALGPYRLTGFHRRGTLGPMLRAEKGGGAFAVRVLPLRSLWQAKQARQLARTLSALPKHPALVPLVDADSANGRHYLVWPLVEGELLADLVRVAGPLLPAEAAGLLAKLAAGLAACHARQVAHGLLTPHAVALGADNSPMLLDLGAGLLWARNLAADESLFDTITTAVAVANFFNCAAPEWLANPTDPTPAGDQYGLGAVGYFALTGKLPAETLRPVAEENPLIPAELAAIIDRLLKPDPADRFTGMDEVHEALVALAGSLPTPAPAPEPEPELPPSLSRASASRAERTGHGSALSLGPTGPVVNRPAERDNTDASVQFDLPDVPLEPEVAPVRPTGKSSRSLYQPAGPFPQPQAGTSDTLPPPSLTPTTPAKRPAVPPPKPPGSSHDRKPARIAAPPVLPAAPLIPEHPAAAKKSGSRMFLTGPGPGAATPAPPEKKSGSVLWKAMRRKAMFWKAPADAIQVSVYGPEATAHSETARLTVFLHPPGAADSVRTLARAFHHDAVLLGTGPLGVEVPRGEKLTVHVAVAHTSVTRPMATAGWQGQPHRLTFDLVVPWGAPAGEAVGVVSVGRADVRVGKVEFRLPILGVTS
jgi:serine/threonine protein kinase